MSGEVVRVNQLNRLAVQRGEVGRVVTHPSDTFFFVTPSQVLPERQNLPKYQPTEDTRPRGDIFTVPRIGNLQTSTTTEDIQR